MGKRKRSRESSDSAGAVRARKARKLREQHTEMLEHKVSTLERSVVDLKHLVRVLIETASTDSLEGARVPIVHTLGERAFDEAVLVDAVRCDPA